MTRSSSGYVATYAVGTTALLVLVGDAGLDTTRLYRESRATIEKLELILAEANSGSGHAAAS